MRLIQYFDAAAGGPVAAVVRDPETVVPVHGPPGGVYALAQAALAAGRPLADLVAEGTGARTVSYQELVDARRLLPPVLPADPARCLVSGTGLTHWGSAGARDAMHAAAAPTGRPGAGTTAVPPAPTAAPVTDSMRMFQLGARGGKPAPGQVGAQPEWFYKGSGHCLVAPEHPLPAPAFALDAGEEPELVGLYLIGPDRQPYRLGFALGNEFSDHVTERANYLWLAHSKLRSCSFGPELLLGAPPGRVDGASRIHRAGRVAWEKPFRSGEEAMCHSVANLEHHHFKYPQFRQPGWLHVHFLGTSTLSFADGFQAQDGDVFEIAAPAFGRPLRNPLRREVGDPVPTPAEVRAL